MTTVNHKASERWKLLRQAILKKSTSNKKTSMTEFSSFNILTGSAVNAGKYPTWYQYTYEPMQSFKIKVKYLPKEFNPEELIGFNNTGNVCVWPAEEVLTYWCLKNMHLFSQKRVCELGGGMTCLAGLSIAACCGADEVLLTDGNETSITNVQEIVLENAKPSGNLMTSTVSTSVLRWDRENEYATLKDTFDYVIAADCLFFDQYREDLLHTIHTILKPQGTCVIFAPRRHQTLDAFCTIAREKFHVTVEDKYDDLVWYKHLEACEKSREIYDENRHYPLKVTLS